MNTVFVVRNQHGLYLTKQQQWSNGADNQSLYRTAHRDEAINSVFEVSSRDIYLRAEAIACELDAKGNPSIEVSAEQPAAADDTVVADPVDDAEPADDTEQRVDEEQPEN